MRQDVHNKPQATEEPNVTLRVDLQLQGPLTADLWEILRDTHPMAGAVFFGKGRTRLEATMDAISNMRTSVKAENRKAASEWAMQALGQLKRSTNDPSRVEGSTEQGLSMYATLWVGPLSPSQEL